MTSQRDNYKDLTKTITVDSQNRITQVQDALSTTIGNYWYDEGGFRVRKKALVPSGAGFKNQEILYPSKFYGLEYAEDTNVLSSINNVYLNGVRIAALNEEGTAAYFLTDQVDSVAHVLDEGAHTLSRMQYEPYGETLVQRGTLDFAPKYNSQELDRETNFYFYNARYYDPQIARFTSADAVIDGARSTQGWNRFSYVAGNPVRYKDPTGHEAETSILKSSLSYSLGAVHGLARSGVLAADKAVDVLNRPSTFAGASYDGLDETVFNETWSEGMRNRYREDIAAWLPQKSNLIGSFDRNFEEFASDPGFHESVDLNSFSKGVNHGTFGGLAATAFATGYAATMGKGSVAGGSAKYYRYVGAAEAKIIQRTGKIPNVDPSGANKLVYYTNRKYETAGRAKTYNQLKNKPSYRVEIDSKNVKNGSAFTRVNPSDNPRWGKGGGVEATTPNSISVDPKKITRLKGG